MSAEIRLFQKTFVLDRLAMETLRRSLGTEIGLASAQQLAGELDCELSQEALAVVEEKCRTMNFIHNFCLLSDEKRDTFMRVMRALQVADPEEFEVLKLVIEGQARRLEGVG